MLCPEVINFKAPLSTIHNQKSEKKNCLNILKDFNFIHSITAVLPDVVRVENLGSKITESDYYRICSLDIVELTSRNFLDNFILSGCLNLLSVKTRIDCDNCIAITSSGKLILNLNKYTFQTLGLEGKVSHFHTSQTLGLEGKVSHFHTSSKEKYIVTIDLKSDQFKPGNSNYERTRACMKKLKPFEVIISWQPPDDKTCPSSVAKYFHDLNYEVKLCKVKRETNTCYSAKVPFIDLNNFDEEHCADFVEWLGMVCLDCKLDEESDYISSYVTPAPYIYLGQVKIVKWRGFFNTNVLQILIEELEKQNSTQLWKVIHFQGFSDSPVVWDSREHNYYTNGDNGGVLLLHNNEIHMSLQKCSNKRYK